MLTPLPLGCREARYRLEAEGGIQAWRPVYSARALKRRETQMLTPALGAAMKGP